MANQENKVTFGLKDLVIFFESDVADESNDSPGIYIDSIISYNRTMNTSTADLYANDRLYFRYNDEKNGDGTMSLANLPKEVVARMLGWRIDSHGGLVHMKDAKPERFDMCFSVQGDQYERRKFVYGCEAAIANDNNETRGENVSYRTEEATITEYGVEVAGEHVWDYTIYEREHPGDFAASKTRVVYPQQAEGTAGAAALATLSIGTLALSPAFDPDVTSYAATTSNATNAITATAAGSGSVEIKVGETEMEPGSAATWADGENTVTITVTNGSATKVYTVVVTKSGE